MALVLSLRTNETIFIGDTPLRVKEIYDDTCFTLERLDEATNTKKTFQITPRRSEEVMPDVFISGSIEFQLGSVKALIDAPRSLLILREDKYWTGDKLAAVG